MTYNELPIGKGLFTKTTIKKKAHICYFEGDVFGNDELKEYINKYKDMEGYWGFVKINQQYYLNTYETDCFANYINSPQRVKLLNGKTVTANAKMVANSAKKTVRVQAMNEIKENEEILMSYGCEFKF